MHTFEGGSKAKTKHTSVIPVRDNILGYVPPSTSKYHATVENDNYL